MKPRRIMTAAEVAEHLHLHVSTVYKMAGTGQIPAFKIGADWRFYNDEIEKWMTDRQILKGRMKAVRQCPN